MPIFSNPEQLRQIKSILSKYLRLPFFTDTIPGAVLESVLAHVRVGKRLGTYDFVDVIKEGERCGWQVKSTKASTPVTWKRAKIANAESLINASRKSDAGAQRLGDAIIEFCNDHARSSLQQYKLEEIGYSRLIINDDGTVIYFEKLICTSKNSELFNPRDFRWYWSRQKNTVKKEQLPAFHGINRKTDQKWWAWHGLGENQLHFSGEKNWWPSSGDSHTVKFQLPNEKEKIPPEKFIELLTHTEIQP